MADLNISSRDLSTPYSTGTGLTFPKSDVPPTITFHSGGGTDGAFFTIKPDGEIVRGPKFTTEDAMSLLFWEKIAEAFPRLLKLTREQHGSV